MKLTNKQKKQQDCLVLRKLAEDAEAEKRLQESSVLFPDVSTPA